MAKWPSAEANLPNNRIIARHSQQKIARVANERARASSNANSCEYTFSLLPNSCASSTRAHAGVLAAPKQAHDRAISSSSVSLSLSFFFPPSPSLSLVLLLLSLSLPRSPSLPLPPSRSPPRALSRNPTPFAVLSIAQLSPNRRVPPAAHAPASPWRLRTARGRAASRASRASTATPVPRTHTRGCSDARIRGAATALRVTGVDVRLCWSMTSNAKPNRVNPKKSKRLSDPC
eukprot:6200434-Pleurochrysis_carterae.AAC.1